MRPLIGPRTVVEAAFLVAVPVIALEAGLRWSAIVGAGAVAYLLVLVVEGAMWRAGARPRPVVPAAAVATIDAPAGREDRVRVIHAPPEPEPVPEPRLEPAPPPSEPQPEPEPAAAVVPIAPAPPSGQWNVWDLERLAREHAGGDAIADEERTFLLMYLRDFAGPDGLLPADFDDLIRESFGAIASGR